MGGLLRAGIEPDQNCFLEMIWQMCSGDNWHESVAGGGGAGGGEEGIKSH